MTSDLFHRRRALTLCLLLSTTFACSEQATDKQEPIIFLDEELPKEEPPACTPGSDIPACIKCSPGTTKTMSDDGGVSCEPILCGVNERVLNHTCTPCPNEEINEAGDNARSGDTMCVPGLCVVNHRVEGGRCVACPPGTQRPAGDKIDGPDTTCAPVSCGKDEYVRRNACLACSPGSSNEAGDDATGADTVCDPLLCLQNQSVRSNRCVSCRPSASNEAGDDASGFNTSCDVPITSLEAGGTRSCVILDDHRLICWGTIPSLLDQPRDVKQLSLGFTSCVAHLDGSASCWGSNFYGQFGDGTTSTRSSNTPVKVRGLQDDVHKIAAADTIICALLEDNRVSCWGHLHAPSVTRPDEKEVVTTPRLISTPEFFGGAEGDPGAGGYIGVVSELAPGVGFLCALHSAGYVSCMGRNDQGQLGVGSGTRNSSAFRVVRALTETLDDGTRIGPVTQVTAGRLHACALLSDGTVRCWGDNEDGQLGDGTTTRRHTPVEVLGLSDVVEISAGNRHTCARLNTGSVKCWGYGGYGMLGDGTGRTSAQPVVVRGIGSRATQIKCAGFYGSLGSGPSDVGHCCALLDDKSVKCWGEQARLGDPTLTRQPNEPVLVLF